MTRAELLAYCMAKPGAWLDEPWDDDQVVKVGEKIFVFLGSPDADAPSFGVKCGRDAEEAGELRRRHPDLARPSAYIGRYGWNSVQLSPDLPEDEVCELVDASYDAIVAGSPRSRRPARKADEV